MREPQSRIDLATGSASMRSAIDALLLAARSEASIMLRAEIGSEVVALARLAHDNSMRRDRPFLSLPCVSMTELPAKALVNAGGGTLFLDEVGELRGALQTRLVHMLDRLSAQGPRPRLISATRRALDEEIGEGRLRKELFFRLAVVEIRIPPLRERPEDILPLAQDLVASLSADLGRRAPVLSRDAEAMLLAHPWPANLRELRNAVERALLIWPADVLDPEAFTELRTADVHRRPRVGDDVTVRDLEREHIRRVMARVTSLKAAAAVLGIDETTLWRRRKQYQGERKAKVERGKAAR